jgi:meiotically up-regulated gene 157 (Mug157) protein
VGKARNMYCSMHNYELDSLCYHIDLSYHYWRASGRSQVFTKEWFRTIEIIFHLFIVEQDHSNISPYRYIELPNDVGNPVTFTGMTWSAFRPSDDQTSFGYLIPSNVYAVVVLGMICEKFFLCILGYLEQIASEVLKDKEWATKFKLLKEKIEDGIFQYGVVDDSEYGKVFAYEVDGKGGVNIMDDANVPSLLSIPYLNYTSKRDPEGLIAANTRKLILSKKNPFYYQGDVAKGIGSPHTPTGYIWHMSLIMEAFTAKTFKEKMAIFKKLQETDANTKFMHESFSSSNAHAFTRSWFAWANSLFAELVIENLDELLKYQS